MINSDFKNKAKKHQLKLLREGFFEDAEGGVTITLKDEKTGKEKKLYCAQILKPDYRRINLYRDIRDEACEYFDRNDITWWKLEDEQKENAPSGHLLSSQVHCLNHLFAIRQDHDAVLKMIQSVDENAGLGIHFDDVLPSFTDAEEDSGESYISFEFVCDNISLLNEEHETRGKKCTSIDALIYACAGSERWLVPIEWKYTEAYDPNEDPEKNHGRYTDFVDDNSRLNSWNDLYGRNPFYELGRQTLLMERLISEKPVIKEHQMQNGKPVIEGRRLQADNFLHLVVVPPANEEMNADAMRFKDSVKEEFQKYVRIITPEELLSPVEVMYPELINYLKKRYWSHD